MKAERERERGHTYREGCVKQEAEWNVWETRRGKRISIQMRETADSQHLHTEKEGGESDKRIRWSQLIDDHKRERRFWRFGNANEDTLKLLWDSVPASRSGFARLSLAGAAADEFSFFSSLPPSSAESCSEMIGSRMGNTYWWKQKWENDKIIIGQSVNSVSFHYVYQRKITDNDRQWHWAQTSFGDLLCNRLRNRAYLRENWSSPKY